MKKQRIGQEQIIFFDGTCSLCAKSIDILRSRDKRGLFKFVAFQYEVARDIIRCHSEHTTFADKSVSLVYLRNGQVKLRSTAVLCILRDLGGTYRLSTLFYLIPVFIRTLFMIKLLSGVISGLENVIYTVIRKVTKSILLCNRGLFIHW